MNYDSRPRENQQMKSDSIKQRVQEQHAKMIKWYKIQSTFLQSVVDKGVGNFIQCIDDLLRSKETLGNDIF